MTHTAQKMLTAIEIVEKKLMTNCLCILRKKKICVFDANCILNHTVLQKNKNYGLISDQSFSSHDLKQPAGYTTVCVYIWSIFQHHHICKSKQPVH